MTQPDRRCGACGGSVPPPYRAPAPESAPDLDLRPGEPTRSTLADWIQTCPHCGAAAPDLAALPASARPVVDTAAYRALADAGPDYAVPFLRWAAILRGTNDRRAAAEAMLQAAWAADDAADSINAASWRAEVAFLWGEPDDAETGLRRIDALRRAGEFAAADAAAERLHDRGLDETSATILAFQRARIATRDIGRHLISSAVRPPAHRPHVAQGPRQSSRGLLSRLFGSHNPK
ncbi:MAG TPA: hypothetical protein VLI93_04815 [Acetobacteraceae bacterium]|nr:hypothetical protein [Acetobacteraceae bacterium]